MRCGKSRNFNLIRFTYSDSSESCRGFTSSVYLGLSPWCSFHDIEQRQIMSGLFGAQANAAQSSNSNSAQGDLSKDIAVSQPPEDSISDLRFSPVAEYLAVASWDKKVRIYEVADNGSTQGKALFDHEGPVLSCCWSKVCKRISYVEERLRAHLKAGRSKSIRWRRRQSRTDARSRRRRESSATGRCARSTYPLCGIDNVQQRTHAHHRRLG